MGRLAKVRFAPSLCENSDVELARRNFVSITLNRKRTALAVAVERGKGRKQFCAFSPRACFHTAWVKTGKAQCEHMFSALPLRADIAEQSRHVRFVPNSDMTGTWPAREPGALLLGMKGRRA